MKVPKIIFSEMRLMPHNIIGITLYPFIILNLSISNSASKLNETIRHEKIHIKQQEELLVIFFYLWYIIEWSVKIFKFGKNAYYHISFEKEAYKFDTDVEYLENRKNMLLLNLFFKKYSLIRFLLLYLYHNYLNKI